MTPLAAPQASVAVARYFSNLGARDGLTWKDIAKAFALVGVPMDLGVTNRSGARLGPRDVWARPGEAAGPEHPLRRRS